jgi:hypothetical protein
MTPPMNDIFPSPQVLVISLCPLPDPPGEKTYNPYYARHRPQVRLRIFFLAQLFAFGH